MKTHYLAYKRDKKPVLRDVVDKRKKSVKEIGGPKVKELKADLAENVSAVKAVGHHDFRVGILLENLFL